MPNVLIVDDSATARMLVRRCLTICGYRADQTFEAEHGRAALDQLKAEGIDLVISDLNMPVMDGRTLLRFMRGSPRLHAIPVIIVSSLVNEAAEEELRAMGATAVIRKPLSPAALAAAISRMDGAAA
ncbi:MAG: response regulator [Deltaproteobacteria bacterium]|jgi:two-component system chemotaxis response regulator CheY|nr:response regulator [Deltaproteobacteria bacterium]